MMRMAALACALFACGGHHSGGGDDTGEDPSNATLTISPQMSEVTIKNGVQPTEAFTATATWPDGTTEDVTAATTFGVGNALGSFAGPTLTVAQAGKAPIVATWMTKAADGQVIAHLDDTRVDPTLDPGIPDVFGAATPDPAHAAPSIVYPPVNVVIPRNLGDFEAHWTDAAGDNVFEVSLHTEFADVRVYVPGGNGEAAAGPMPSWSAFLADEWMAAVGNETSIQVQVRGLNTASPTTLGASTPLEVKLSNEPMEGGLYYWASVASSGVSGVYRHDMSKPGQPAEQYMTTAQTAGRCVACHVLSRDGTKMSITYDGGGGAATMIDVASSVAQASAANWNFGTFTTHEGDEFIAVEDGKFTVRKYTDQSVLASMTITGKASHPDMSPDGTQLVWVREGSPGSDWQFGVGAIVTATYDAATRTIGPERVLVTNAQNNYYPSWSPDGQWILYNVSTGGSYNDPTASLWVVKADGGSPPIQLGTANAATGGLFNSWGRWAPFQQSLGSNSDPIYWITVSSQRTFGVRRQLSEAVPQIWMFAFQPSLAGQMMDPSTPSFWLPFQDFTSHNHIAQWTEKVVITQ